MLIYVEYITERLLYTLSFVFAERKVAYELTNDGIAFIGAKGPKLNYSNRDFEDALQIIPAELLFEDELLSKPPTKSAFEGIECLEFNGTPDVLASIFYVLSRMEEYQIFSTDALDRFEASSSVAFTHNWLQVPICDEWTEALISYL